MNNVKIQECEIPNINDRIKYINKAHQIVDSLIFAVT